MELYQLKSFIAIAREGNLTRAASVLNLSQSALSSQLKALEEELGVALFTRTARGMVLTQSGQTLLAEAREIIEVAAQLKRKAKELCLGRSASVTIGLNADPGFLRVGEINRQLGLNHPEINLAFLTSQTVNNSKMLRQGDIDLGFQYGEVLDEEIEHAVIGRTRVCLVIPTGLFSDGGDDGGGGRGNGENSGSGQGGQLRGWREVFELPWIWAGDDCPFYKIIMEQIEVLSAAPNQLVSALDEQILRELVVAGQGVAMMREDEARPLADGGKVAIWDKGWLDLPLSIAWLAKNSRESRIQEVRQVITSVWRDLEVWDEMPWMRR